MPTKTRSRSRPKNTRSNDPFTHQLELPFKSRGGKRKGAGRKRQGPRPRVPHRTRPKHSRHNPVHVTTRLVDDLPTLRNAPVFDVVRTALVKGSDRFGFRLIEFSVQSNHLHLIAEAPDKETLSRGMQGLLVRVAKALNKYWNRKGRVFADRFHARALTTPREVRNGLCYLLHNRRRHGDDVPGIDPFSSGPYFEAWEEPHATPFPHRPTPRARTWLLATGWLRHGRISTSEKPRGRSR